MLRPYLFMDLGGQPQRKCASLARRAVHFDAAPWQLRKQSRDRETEPGSSQLATAGLIDPEETIEDPIQMLRRDPGARVLHAHTDFLPMWYDRKHDAAARRVAHRVGREIQQDVACAIGISDDIDSRGRLSVHDQRVVQSHRLPELSDLF